MLVLILNADFVKGIDFKTETATLFIILDIQNNSKQLFNHDYY